MENANLSLEITELTLGLPGNGSNPISKKKRVFSDISDGENSSSDDGKNPAKSLVVGWPPVCAFRIKNNLKQKGIKKTYVKISVDGAPFLRKIDLNAYKCYSDLLSAIKKLFNCFGIGNSELSEFNPIYEDKDGDWMLVGDVPWEMFIESCKRLRIMKGSDGKGFKLQAGAPRCPSN